ncbi:MAG: VCBS repeat-containing protein [Saprospiraceae bacterium]|nr:VCBS repeat-containing protein [Candidatus Opimibacter skivensis]
MLGWVEQIPSVKVKSYLFRNKGNLQFSDVSETWNSGTPAFSNGAAYADLDNDGYLDIIVNNIDEPAFVLKNDGKSSRANNFIRFTLIGEKGKTTYGTRVRINTADGQYQEQVYYPTRGFSLALNLSSISESEIVQPLPQWKSFGQTGAFRSSTIRLSIRYIR